MNLQMMPESFRVILCDIWGCVHNGERVFPQAAALLEAWRAEERSVILITNAPRPSHVIVAQLDALGLRRTAYDAVVTSGDTGIAALKAKKLLSVGFIGTAADRIALADSGLNLGADAEGMDVVCTGLRDGQVQPEGEDPMLQEMQARGATLHCFNPDRVVVRGERLEPCAGAIAERYEGMGGIVVWYGKPYPPIYDRCLSEASRLQGRQVSPAEVVAVGDSLSTDFRGAAEAGFAFVFVTHGIEADKVEAAGAEAVVRRYRAEAGGSLPEPIATVRELG